MSWRTVLATLVIGFVAVSGCDSDPSSPTLNVSGTFIGDYTSELQPGVVLQGVLQLTQSGNAVTGSLTTNAGRAGNIQATLTGQRLEGTIQFTDQCGGSAATTVDVTSGGLGLTGNYQAVDCLGSYRGGYLLTKQ